MKLPVFFQVKNHGKKRAFPTIAQKYAFGLICEILFIFAENVNCKIHAKVIKMLQFRDSSLKVFVFL